VKGSIPVRGDSHFASSDDADANTPGCQDGPVGVGVGVGAGPEELEPPPHAVNPEKEMVATMTAASLDKCIVASLAIIIFCRVVFSNQINI
tara:strand:- start:447 stop:719 length:273 start_codon:yes stop_codon:yes gene_type:complete